MNTAAFFSLNPVFTYQEFTSHVNRAGERSHSTCESLIAHHLKQGRIIRIKRGLYGVIPLGADPKYFQIDPFLVASKLSDDAVIAYHTALALLGSTYSIFPHYSYLTHSPRRKMSFQHGIYQAIQFPKKLKDSNQELMHIKEVNRQGITVKVTNHERTLVDMLDRPDLTGSWEEIWRSLELVEYFDIHKVIEYALALQNATTIAKVGFFLEQHQEILLVEKMHLETLRANIPKQPHYMSADRNQPVEYNKKWNLIIPKDVVLRSWEEL